MASTGPWTERTYRAWMMLENWIWKPVESSGVMGTDGGPGCADCETKFRSRVAMGGPLLATFEVVARLFRGVNMRRGEAVGILQRWTANGLVRK